jgi:dienelactone hydrolase
MAEQIKPKIYNIDRYILSSVLHVPKRQTTSPAVILLHGFTGYKDENHIVSLADALAESGIYAIRFDTVGYGESEGTIEDDFRLSNYMYDIDTIYNFLTHYEGIDSASIGIWGHSMGGLASIIYATENRRIKAVSAVSAPSFFGSGKWLRSQIPQWEKTGSLTVESSRYGTISVPYDFYKDAKKYSALDVVAKLSQPLQIIAGAADQTVELSDTKQLFDAAPEPKELLEITEMTHDYKRYPEILTQVNDAVVTFFTSNLK